MKLRRLIAILTALMTMTVFSHSVSAERIKFSAPQVSSADGVTTVTYTLTEPPVGERVTLIAMYIDSESGNILSVNSASCEDVSLLTDGKISVEVTDKSAEGGVLKHYLWRNLDDIIWFKDFAPSSVNNVKATRDSENPGTKINLSWNASEDDWDDTEDLKYNVYDMGLLVKENLSEASYSAEKLPWGTKFNFEIEAVDSAGNISERSAGAGAETIIPYSIFATDEIASTDSNLVYKGESDADAYYKYATSSIDGIPCITTSTITRNGTAAGTYHSVQVSQSMAGKMKAGTDVVFEIEYLSDTNSQLRLEIFGSTSDSSFAPSIKNDGKWNVLTFKETLRADFELEGRKGHNYSHIRFTGRNDAAKPLYVRRITFMPLSEYEAMNPERAAYLDIQEGIIHNGLEFSSTPEIENIDGSYCVKAEDLTVRAGSEVAAGDATGIEVMYYAPEGIDSFTINGVDTEVTQNGCWQKARVMLDGGLATTSFVIDGGVYIDNVRLLNGLPEL